MTGKARILFVDDEKRVLNSMRGLFRREYELFLTCEGAEAVKIASENDIDVVVADQRMPGMTGVEVLAKIKDQSPRTVRILLTGYADPSAVEGSINIGEVFRFLSKPCPPKMLRETLTLAISAARTKPLAATPPAAAVVKPTPQTAPVPQPAPTPLPAPEPTIQAMPAPSRPATPVAAPAAQLVRDMDETQPALKTLDEAALKSAHEHSTSHWQSVTNVVMSEDTVEETRSNVALTSSTLSTRDVGVVIFTVDSDFAETAIRAVSADRNMILATTLVKVAQAIREQNAGVLVTDFTTNNTILKKIIAALKQRMPHLVTIVVTGGRDTNDMIGLINYGQVFRYLLKPIDSEQLRSDINAAVIRHLYLLNNPESAKRHRVIDTLEAGHSSTTVNRFIGNIDKQHGPVTDPTDTIS